jgi:hypothetical protein
MRVPMMARSLVGVGCRGPYATGVASSSRSSSPFRIQRWMVSTDTQLAGQLPLHSCLAPGLPSEHRASAGVRRMVREAPAGSHARSRQPIAADCQILARHMVKFTTGANTVGCTSPPAITEARRTGITPATAGAKHRRVLTHLATTSTSRQSGGRGASVLKVLGISH